MKERYVKPLLLFESFSLSQTIARDCGDTHNSSLGQSNHYNPNTCNWIVGEGDGASVYFFYGACRDAEEIGFDEEYPGSEEDLDEVVIKGFCYNNPDGGQMLFSST